jgi:divalent metal cation (Fe/Co/Zn/Cd) transporter
MEHVHHDACCSGSPPVRADHVAAGLRLEYLTVSWNVVEGAIAVSAALAAGSVALLGFGIDSFVECSAGVVMIWRLRAEQLRRVPEAKLHAIERRAQQLVAGSLVAVAMFVAVDAVRTLVGDERPEFSLVGTVLTSVSLVVMQQLARAKRRVAAALESRAMAADAFQTTACWWLSLAALTGVALNGLFGWWWADPAAALAIAGLIIKEAREAWNGEGACC